MTTTMKRKVVETTAAPLNVDNLDLFVDAPADASDADDVDDSDSSDSEESVYSGLEEEADTEDEDEDLDDGDDEEEEEDADGSTHEEDDQPENKKIEPKLKTAMTRDQEVTAGEPTENNSRNKRAVNTDVISSVPGPSSARSKVAPDEYRYDSSDEEDIRNTVGNIPMEWYREYSHIGYDLSGRKIIKPKVGDELDKFLNRMDNPNYGRTVIDRTTGQSVVLSDNDLELVQRLRKGMYVDPNYNPYEPWHDTFTSEIMIHPVTNHPQHKSSFIPSKWERQKVGEYVHAMKMGWMKPKPVVKEIDEDEVPTYFDLWVNDGQSEINKRFRQHIPAPRMRLPGHSESYNPPPEYLLTEEEELAWQEQEPEERKLNFVPRKYSSLRSVPGFERFTNERFERCLDLYLCPRQRKMRANVDPEDLLPKLPKPSDLQPFPSTLSLVYRGHVAMVRSISVSPCGQWLASGSDDGSVRVWEVSTARCLRTLEVGGVVKSVAWNPNPSLCLLAVAVDVDIVIINLQIGDKLIQTNTDASLSSYVEVEKTGTVAKLPVKWQEYTEEERLDGFRLKVTHPKPVSEVTWHGKGDYFSAVLPRGESMSVLIHQLLKRRSQNPFRKSKGLVQCVLFHPVRPVLFVATQRYVRVYNLLKQLLVKKLMTNCKWVSSMAVHRAGDNVIIGSYDCRLSWFDLDLSTKPYQVLRHHKKAIRKVCYHKTYPLFASASDDATLIVCHGTVYDDLLQNPLIVPVKVLRGHVPTSDLGVLDCAFHPTQPWLFSSGADHTVRLFT